MSSTATHHLTPWLWLNKGRECSIWHILQEQTPLSDDGIATCSSLDIVVHEFTIKAITA